MTTTNKRVKVIHVPYGPRQPQKKLTAQEQLQYLKERAMDGASGHSGNIKGNQREDQKRWERYIAFKSALEETNK